MAELIRIMEKTKADDFGWSETEIKPPDTSCLKLLCNGKPFTELTPDGKLRKKVVKEGLFGMPKHLDQVVLVYNTFSEEGKPLEVNTVLSYIIGEDQVIDALELCVLSMRGGEEAVVISDSEYAFGRLGHRPEYQPNQRVIFNIVLANNTGHFNHKEPMTLRMRTDMVKQMINRGHFLYVRGLFDRAAAAYSGALMYLFDYEVDRRLPPMTDEQHALVEFLHYNIYSSLAPTHLKMKRYRAALLACDQVLKLKPFDVKGNYRKGMCLTALGNKKAAMTYLTNAYEYDNKNFEILKEINKLCSEQNSEQSSRKEKKRGQGGKYGRKSRKNANPKDKAEGELLTDLPENFTERRTEGIETVGEYAQHVATAKHLLEEYGSKLVLFTPDGANMPTEGQAREREEAEGREIEGENETDGDRGKEDNNEPVVEKKDERDGERKEDSGKKSGGDTVPEDESTEKDGQNGQEGKGGGKQTRKKRKSGNKKSNGGGEEVKESEKTEEKSETTFDQIDKCKKVDELVKQLTEVCVSETLTAGATGND